MTPGAVPGGAGYRGGGGGTFMMLPICGPFIGGDDIGGGGGTWKGRAGSLFETCLWPPGYMMGNFEA